MDFIFSDNFIVKLKVDIDQIVGNECFWSDGGVNISNFYVVEIDMADT